MTQTGTLQGSHYRKLNGDQAEGTIKIELLVTPPVIRDEAGNVIWAGDIEVPLDGGAFTVTLPAGDGNATPAIAPPVFSYRVTEQLKHITKSRYRSVIVQVPAGGTLDLADVDGGNAATPVLAQPITQVQLDAALDDYVNPFLGSYVTAAQTAETNAETAETNAETAAAAAQTAQGLAEDARDTASEIALGDADATLATAIGNPASDTYAALSASFLPRAEVFRSVKEFGAVCDGVTDDTAAVQAAFDEADGVWFPGKCKVTAPIVVTRNVPIAGFNGWDAGLVWGGAVGAASDVLVMHSLSLKTWYMQGVTIDATNARHAVSFTGDITYQTAFSRISGCALIGGSGYAINTTNQFGYNQICGNYIAGGINIVSGVDGTHIMDNYMAGNGWAVQLDLLNGARNTTIRHNVITNKGGMLHVVNGSNVRFVDNQCESLTGFSNTPNALVWIEGLARDAYNCVIEENNFSAIHTTSVLKVDRATKTTFDKNHVLSGSGDDLILGTDSSLTKIGDGNYVNSTVLRPRLTSYWPLRVTDAGVGNTGPRAGSVLSLQNGWTLNGHIMRTRDNRVEIVGTLEGGTTTAATVIGTLPFDLRPVGRRRLAVSTASGPGTLLIDQAGVITVESIPSGSQVALPIWQSGYTDGVKQPTITDDFNRADAATLGGSWLISGTAVYAIASNKATWVSGFGYPYREFGAADMRVTGTVTGTNTSQQTRLTARFNSSTDHYGITAQIGSAASVRVKVANVETTLATGPTVTSGDTFSLYVKEEPTGTRVIGLRNGVVFCNVLDTTVGRPTATKAGLYAWGSFGTYDVGVDDFSVEAA